MGLGLSIVRSVTTAHHGTVTARSRPAGGLDVSVRLPGAPAAAPGSARRHGRGGLGLEVVGDGAEHGRDLLPVAGVRVPPRR